MIKLVSWWHYTPQYFDIISYEITDIFFKNEYLYQVYFFDTNLQKNRTIFSLYKNIKRR